jgi:hypothetical protein
MPRRPIKHRDDAVVQLMIRMPGWLKNKIAVHADGKNLSMNKWAAGILFRALQAEQGIPEPPPAKYPLPTLEESIRIQLRGDTLFEPCGKPAPCEREEAGTSTLQGMEFCNHCQVRIQ